MTERGEYRAIRRVLLDGPDFQKLPERARWVFVALKLNFGPSGIEVHYPAALTAMLSAQTGATCDEVDAALRVLEEKGWIQREANVVVVVKQLENDPHVKVVDEKHRKSVHRHVAGLPRIALVRAFIRARKGWFPPEECASMGLEWAIKGASKGLPSTDNKPEDKSECEAPAGPTFADAWAIYPKRNGSNSRVRAEEAWNARLALQEDSAAMLAGVKRFRAWADAAGKTGTELVMQGKRFFGPGKHYLEDWELPEDLLDPVAAAAIAARDQQTADDAWLEQRIRDSENGKH